MSMKTSTKIFSLLALFLLAAASVSCGDRYMKELNTDTSKATVMDPNSLLTTALLQTYGDFGMMDTYRSYITGFTQYMAGGWNVTAYAGSVHADNDQMSQMWNRIYGVGVKNLVDGIANSAELPNVNAVLRITRVYMMSLLTDTYGDVPCSEAGLGFISGISNPKYDTQESIYDFFFTELTACAAQLNSEKDRVSGDVTAYKGDLSKWRKFANALRMRFAMRISDVNPAKARAEFEAAVAAGTFSSADDDAYVIYMDAPFTLYEGARELDFRANALGEMLYGQDFSSPSFVCATFFNQLKNTGDPRLYRICRHYINTKRSSTQADDLGNVDVTDEVRLWEASNGGTHPVNVGAAWYSVWVNGATVDEIPTLKRLVESDPSAGYDAEATRARMVRPFLSIDFEKATCPGILMTYGEVNFLLAEAKSKGWNVAGETEELFKTGVRAAMQLINEHYVPDSRAITEAEISDFLANLMPTIDLTNAEKARQAINTQAWILHLSNPSEGWANMRRSDYPVLVDRSNFPQYDGFTYDDNNMSTPVRLKYPNMESKYNSAAYAEAIAREPLNGKDDWHTKLWWDKFDGHFE